MLNFIRRLFSPAAPETDLSYGLLTAQGFDKLLASKQWPAFEAAALQLAPDDLTRLLDGLTNRYAALLQEYLAAGQSELRTLAHGARTLFLAWEARGSLVAAETSAGQVDGFFHYLSQTLDILNQPFENTRLHAEAGARLVRVGMGIGEFELAQEAFGLCHDLVPRHLMGHYNYLRAVSPWWHEGLTDLTTFVDSITDLDLRRIMQLICLHEIHSFARHETNSEATATRQLKQNHGPRLEAALAGPAHQEGQSLQAIYYNNYLAALHHLLGDRAARNRLILALGPNITPYPWHYFGLDNSRAVQRLAA
jgi:hypothetical protein